MDESIPLPRTMRLADAVYERLTEAIISGDLAPGERVRDGELADQLGVSRMPVREALQRLERQGLVEMVASRYTRVTEITPDMPAASMEFLGYQFGVLLRIAIPRLDEAGRDRAARDARELADAVMADPALAYDTARRFSEHLATDSGNPLAEHLLADSWVTLTRNVRGAFPLVKDAGELRSELLELAAIIEDGDAAAAEAKMREVFLLGPGQPGPAQAVAHLGEAATAD
ncbi:GntR family transcriptional regulator [Microbacterium sp. ZXX196]|uniref:GntR family transcriptional regulator n=1 Tax=Microbacterium sp. ZXX196 TaxID=2609291 RepID=UPI0012B8327C|nr:GntR family transcriptional regulator [Microbacterium sp. ZXX196]MTE24503.1 GntR family transcriptional regulator [Microbacterium sp. ZXX196]